MYVILLKDKDNGLYLCEQIESLNARQIVNSAKDINMKSENSLIILKD